jgi:hypothetical protein
MEENDKSEKIVDKELELELELEETAPSAPIVPPPRNEFIDNLTLELFMNKNHYNRYISQKHPKKFSELQEYFENLETHRESILEITNELLDDPQKQLTTKITDLFQEYTKTLIEYIQDKRRQEREEQNSYGHSERDQDVLFSNMDGQREPTTQERTKSFWSKEKIVKK